MPGPESFIQSWLARLNGAANVENQTNGAAGNGEDAHEYGIHAKMS